MHHRLPLCISCWRGVHLCVASLKDMLAMQSMYRCLLQLHVVWHKLWFVSEKSPAILLPWLQLLEEASMFQVVPFMTNLELNRLKDDKHHDSERAATAQEVCLFVHRALAPEYRGRFRLQVGLST